MNRAQSNPYAVQPTDIDGVRDRRTPVLHTLFHALVFTVSFFFLAVSLKSGVSFAWKYTLEMLVEFWFLVGQIFVFHAVLQRVCLPRLRFRHFWIPMLAGVAAMLGFNSYYDFVSPFAKYLEVFRVHLMAVAPVVVGIIVEVCLVVPGLAVMRLLSRLVPRPPATLHEAPVASTSHRHG